MYVPARPPACLTASMWGVPACRGGYSALYSSFASVRGCGFSLDDIKQEAERQQQHSSLIPRY